MFLTIFLEPDKIYIHLKKSVIELNKIDDLNLYFNAKNSAYLERVIADLRASNKTSIKIRLKN